MEKGAAMHKAQRPEPKDGDARKVHRARYGSRQTTKPEEGADWELGWLHSQACEVSKVGDFRWNDSCDLVEGHIPAHDSSVFHNVLTDAERRTVISLQQQLQESREDQACKTVQCMAVAPRRAGRHAGPKPKGLKKGQGSKEMALTISPDDASDLQRKQQELSLPPG